jgi:hypothetical protein
MVSPQESRLGGRLRSGRPGEGQVPASRDVKPGRSWVGRLQGTEDLVGSIVLSGVAVVKGGTVDKRNWLACDGGVGHARRPVASLSCDGDRPTSGARDAGRQPGTTVVLMRDD